MKKLIKIVLLLVAILLCGTLIFSYWLANGNDDLVTKSVSESNQKFTFLFPKTSVPFKEKSSIASASKNGPLGLTIHEVNSAKNKTCEQRGGKSSLLLKESSNPENTTMCGLDCNLNDDANQCYTLEITADNGKYFEVVIYGKDISQRENIISKIMSSVRLANN